MRRGRFSDPGERPPLGSRHSLAGAAGSGSAPAASEVVGISGLQAGPLGGGTSINAEILLAFESLRPAGRRVLPGLLPPVDGQVEQAIAVVHRFDAAPRRPVGLEDI